MSKKVKEYFGHDYDSSNDPKLSAMVGEFKAPGYGVYWRVIEMLHKEGGYLPLTNVSFSAIGRSIECDADFVKKVVEKSISDYKLFFVRKEKFSSKRVLKNLQKRTDLKTVKSKAGKASAEKRKQGTYVEHTSTAVQHNSTKERKEEERKEKERMRKELASDQYFLETTAMSWGLTIDQIIQMSGDFFTEQLSKGKEWKDYPDFKNHFFSWGKYNNRYTRYKKDETGKKLMNV